jgi:hypothetical protein
MIDISKHLNQLDLLREYMFDKIDGKGQYFYLDLSALPPYTFEDIIDLYNMTGVMIPSKRDMELQPKPQLLTFEEYLNSKQ